MSNDLDPAGMTADDHIAEAERLLSEDALNRAQVHATLAVAKRLREHSREA